MKISIIVPNFNGDTYLDYALRSLVEQNYPDLEILVIDGGSTDKSVEIIESYADQIAWWVSEPDESQSEAINKGLRRATGDVVNWLCSDDILLPGTLSEIARTFAQHPTIDVVVGRCQIEHTETGKITHWIPDEEALSHLAVFNPFPQPSTFYRRELLRRSPPVLDHLHYAMDFELWNYFAKNGASFHLIDSTLSLYRMTGENKTSVGGMKTVKELREVASGYLENGENLCRDYARWRLWLDLVRLRSDSRLLWRLTAPFYRFATGLLNRRYGDRRVHYHSLQILRFAQ